ncbi:RNA-binding protein 48 isoform X2 [Sceloporus undulatus]|uniref:RNA-binding protein 48 isoform X2 n=1 Tax=Sceloporus undulatus TaxID=8520 RepID=UPI001C4BF589|nr:RNA-binding protein 48 isoform X2 [Sceloporus undulatus]
MAASFGASSGGGVGGACQHHAQRAVCASRAKYREGRRPRAVKVYTVNLESRYLLIQGVPALGVMKELVEQFALYGTIEEYNPLDDYPAEEFTEVYLIKFQKIQSARVAKRKLDERSFFGSLLHVCYAPEFESIQETREKLQDRRKYIAKATSNKEQLLVKKQVSNASFQKSPHLDISGSYTSEASTSNQNPLTYVHDPCQSSCYELSVHSVAAPSRGHCNSALIGPQHFPVCAQTMEYFTQSSTMTQGLQEQIHNISACSNMQRKPPCDNGLGRFMPRTTQLQERKRRRDEDNKLALLGRITDSEEIIIGPRLPETPKIDLEDDSLNTSANLIRNRLKEVTVPVQTPKLSEGIPINSQTNPAMKQRRRI